MPVRVIVKIGRICANPYPLNFCDLNLRFLCHKVFPISVPSRYYLRRRAYTPMPASDKKIVGFNVGINVGEVAAHTVFHVHVHLIAAHAGICAGGSGATRPPTATLCFNAHCKHWPCPTTQLEAVESVTKVVRHGRYVTFELAEVAVPRNLFREILRLIDDLRPRSPARC